MNIDPQIIAAPYWFKNKMTALERRGERDRILVSKDANDEGAKWFNWCPSYDALHELVYSTADIYRRNYYENTLHDQPCALYFDFDGRGVFSERRACIEQLLTLIRDVNNAYWPGLIDVRHEHLYVTEACCSNIISLHIVVRMVLADTQTPVVFKNPGEMKRYYMLMDTVSRKSVMPPFLDPSVARAGAFRLLACTKRKPAGVDVQPFRVYSFTDTEASAASMSDEELRARTCVDAATFRKYCVTYLGSSDPHFLDMDVDSEYVPRAVKYRRLVGSRHEPAAHEQSWEMPTEDPDTAYVTVTHGLTELMRLVITPVMEDVIEILVHLPVSFANIFTRWCSVGCILARLALMPGAVDGDVHTHADACRMLWHGFSQRSVKYSYADAEQRWRSFAIEPDDPPNPLVPLKNLFWLYDGVDKRARTLACSVVFCSHTVLQFSQWAGERLRGSYVYDPQQGIYSLCKRSSRWTAPTSHVRAVIGQEFVGGVVHRELDMRRNQVNELYHGKELVTKLRHFDSLSNTVFSTTFAGHVMTQITQFGFGRKIDCEPYTITFLNCVYDLITGDHRPIEPDDYVSRSVGYPYIEPADEEVAEVERVFKDILYEESVYNWTMAYMSTCLLGVHHENMVFFTGQPEDPGKNGSNGKSTFINWIMKALGDYACRLQGSALACTEISQPNAHTSHLLPMVGARAAYVVEIPADMTLDLDSMIKPVTGGDSIKLRALHHEEQEVVLPVTLFATCNMLPNVRGRDHATWRRLRAVWFKRWFCDRDQYDPTNPRHALKVDNLHTDDKANAMRMATMKLLLRHLSRYVRRGMRLPDCPQVRESTADFKDCTDTLKDFLEANFVRGTPEELAEERSWTTLNEMRNIARRKKFKVTRDRDFRVSIEHYYGLKFSDPSAQVQVRSRNPNELGIVRQRKRSVLIGVSPVANDNTISSTS